VDLTQAIRKATGADYFYSYDISGPKEFNSGPQKNHAKAYLKKTVVTGTVVSVDYDPVDYSNVKASRSYSYMFNYKLVNAFSGQIVSSQNMNVVAQDAVEYNEFAKSFNSNNLNNLFPYHPGQVAPVAQYNPSKWRQLFSANATLKSFEVLKGEANNKAVDLFSNSILTNIK
jgi:hypothetical protein